MLSFRRDKDSAGSAKAERMHRSAGKWWASDDDLLLYDTAAIVRRGTGGGRVLEDLSPAFFLLS